MASKVQKKKTKNPVKDKSPFAVYEREDLLRRIGRLKGALTIIAKASRGGGYLPVIDLGDLQAVARKCLDEDEIYTF